MKYIRKFFLWLLPIVAKWHPKNKIKGYREKYPQLWYCMPKRWKEVKGEYYPNGQPKLKRRPLRIIIEHICGFLTGHEISKTESGYGGGRFIDKNCRWCDRVIQVPIEECELPKEMTDIMPLIGGDNA